MTAFELTQQCRSTPSAQRTWQNSSAVYPLNTWTHTDYWHMNRNPKSQYTNVYTRTHYHLPLWKNSASRNERKCTEHNENGTHASFRRRSPRGGDSSQGARALCYGLQQRAVFNMGITNWNFPAFPAALLLTVRTETAPGSVRKTESRCQRCWGHVLSPAVENRGSDTESSFPSSCSRWETAPPGRLRHKWYTASSPTGSWAGRSPWTWSGWTTGPDSTVWGSRGPGVTTGGSTWSLRVGPPSMSSDIRRDATQSQIPCVSARD